MEYLYPGTVGERFDAISYSDTIPSRSEQWPQLVGLSEAEGLSDTAASSRMENLRRADDLLREERLAIFRKNLQAEVCVPLDLLGLPDHVLHPATPTTLDMDSWFRDAVYPNPIPLAMGPACYYKRPDCKYTPAKVGPFSAPWPCTHNDTVQRQNLLFLIHHGNEAVHSLEYGHSSVLEKSTNNDAMNTGLDLDYWRPTNLFSYVLPRDPSLEKYVRQQLKTIDNEARAGMMVEALKVWSYIDPQVHSMWYEHVRRPSRITQIMLYWIRNGAVDGRRVKWLIGKPLRTHLDVDALYQPHFEIRAYNQQLDIHFDLVSLLKQCLEYSCAHMLAEVFKCYYVGDGSPYFIHVLEQNLSFVSQRIPEQVLLFNAIEDFPYIPVPSGMDWKLDVSTGSFSFGKIGRR